MEKDEIYVASFRDAGQISPDHWDVGTRVKVCDKNTTLGELRKWYKKLKPGSTGLYVEISTAEE